MTKKNGNFDGFSPETQEILIGIRHNNNKEWFDAHKDDYNKFVHNPMTALADEIYEKMRVLDSSFDGLPKVCRVYRDTRFTNNKERYKDSKWFFLRADGQIGIQHEKPTYFFEVTPELYQYGFGFWSDSKGMAKFIKHVQANPANAERFVSDFNMQNFFALDGEYYKKERIDKESVSEPLYDWCMRKNFTFWHKNDYDNILFEKSFADFIYNKFAELYPLYRFFTEISMIPQ